MARRTARNRILNELQWRQIAGAFGFAYQPQRVAPQVLYSAFPFSRQAGKRTQGLI